MSKSFFIDTSRCTACRGCQVACKAWHDLPAEKTRNMGSYQNPQDLSAITYKLVRFNEINVDGALRWLFFPEQCRHCIEPPCKLQADMEAEGAILQDPETGAIIYTEKTKDLSFDEGSEFCPYNIPRKNPATGQWAKCDMCIDRVQAGMLPACVQACPTGTMNFGDREEMLALANERLALVKEKRPSAILANAEDVNVIYLLEYDPKDYYEFAVAEAAPAPVSRRGALATLIKPLRGLGRGV